MFSESFNRRRFLLVLFGAILLVCSLLPACGSGAEEKDETSPVVGDTQHGIFITSSQIRTDFPKSLTFELEARSGSPITSIELRYKIIKVTQKAVTATIKPEFDPGREIDAVWIWDTRKTSLPPGAEIQYRWIIKDEAGERLESDTEGFVFDDLRYKWKELAEGNISLFWYDGDTDFGQALMAAGQAALVKLEASTGGVPQKRIKIYIYANGTDLKQALVFPQEWTGGIAFTEYGIVAIGISEDNLSWGKRTVAHELSHLVIEQVTASPYNASLPTWLNEGLAMYVEGDLRYDLVDDLDAAIEKDKLFSVASLSGSFSADPAEARLAYAQSYSLVSFLIENYGSQKMLQFLNTFKDGSTPDDALLAVYGFDGAQLNDLWISTLGLRNQAENVIKDDSREMLACLLLLAVC